MNKAKTISIIQIHNCYQHKGGEESVVENEYNMLSENGNLFEATYICNSVIDNFAKKVLTTLFTPFSFLNGSYLSHFPKQSNISIICHVHNYFPLLSPSIFYYLKMHNIPVVHTLHNYRAICPTALLTYKNKIEERSLKKSSWWAVPRKVYKDSYIGTFALCCMIELHKCLKTWHKKVDAFIALTEFSRDKYIEAGWPANKIFVKPNFIPDKFGGISSPPKKGGYILFVGRLSVEKGIEIILKAMEFIRYPLKIIGTGPCIDSVLNCNISNVEYLGSCKSETVLHEMQNADFLIMASTWYEGFPMVLVEAMCCGTPAVVPKLGGMEEIVKHGKTGLHFEPNNAADLVEKVNYLLDNISILKTMSYNARQEYLNKYTPEINYQQLMDIYKHAINNAS